LKLKPVLAAFFAVSFSCAALAAEPLCTAPGAQPAESAQVTARAIEWAQAQASAALQTGKPLPANLQAIAKGNGVKLPQNIRLVVVDEIPLPKEQPLAGAAAKLGLASSWAAGLTLGYAVIVAKGYESDPRILSHELRHVAQYEACGGIPGFLGVHLADMLERGYQDSRFEVDARAHERH
jgi:hypothetical protein